MEFSWGAAALMVSLIPTALLYVGVGMIVGVSFSDKQVGGFFSIFVNLTAWMSGVWFDMKLIGGVYTKICAVLPFYHAWSLRARGWPATLPACFRTCGGRWLMLRR